MSASICASCGKPFDGTAHVCESIEWLGASAQPAPTGWICPVCGSGMAPHATRCPCKDQPIKFTTGVSS